MSAGLGQEGWKSLEIPIGVGDSIVAQVAGQDGQAINRASFLGLPAQQHPAGKGVPQIMEAWPPRFRQSLTELTKEFFDRATGEWTAVFGHEKVFGFRVKAPAAALVAV